MFVKLRQLYDIVEAVIAKLRVSPIEPGDHEAVELLLHMFDLNEEIVESIPQASSSGAGGHLNHVFCSKLKEESCFMSYVQVSILTTLNLSPSDWGKRVRNPAVLSVLAIRSSAT